MNNSKSYQVMYIKTKSNLIALFCVFNYLISFANQDSSIYYMNVKGIDASVVVEIKDSGNSERVNYFLSITHLSTKGIENISEHYKRYILLLDENYNIIDSVLLRSNLTPIQWSKSEFGHVVIESDTVRVYIPYNQRLGDCNVFIKLHFSELYRHPRNVIVVKLKCINSLTPERYYDIWSRFRYIGDDKAIKYAKECGCKFMGYDLDYFNL